MGKETKAVTITIPEGITDRPWWDSGNAVRLWLVLSIEAGKGSGNEVRMSLRSLANAAGISFQNLRTSIGKLQSSGDIEITHEATHDSTHKISVIKLSGTISSEVKEEDTQHTEQHTKQHATKSGTRAEKEEKMRERMKAFYAALVPYVATYGKEMVRDFYNYWSEPNKSKSAMRYESERTWDLVRRLDYWQRRSSSYQSGKRTQNADPLGRYKEGMERINRMFSDNDGDEQPEETGTWGFFDGPDEQ